ncbi:MAG: TIGR03986 family CRISPR-associated RAMP protein [Clostridiaceae bacterium]|jgi:CRISPR-associated protein (TIGR03986 family)|nr:TIGR03986 family CRISPR-associated RAMP protein [Clostridiaceae bacterium]
MKPINIDHSNEITNFAVAPYNFVSLHKWTYDRYKKIDELPAHNSFKGRDGGKLHTGFIEYTLKAETPIIVADRVEEDGGNKVAYFFKNTDGNYAIPGNTIRGMVRSNAQILGFSSVRDDIQDSTFLYRDVAGNNSLSNKYKTVLGIDAVKRIALNVQAGIMHTDGKRYYITPSKALATDRNYFRVDEIWLRKNVGDKVQGIQYMYKKALLDEEKQLDDIKKEIRELKRRDIIRSPKLDNLNYRKNAILRKHAYGEKIHVPYQIEISFEYSNDNKAKRITKIGDKRMYKSKGFLLTGGFIRGKMSHYVVPKESDEESFMIYEDTITSYKDDLIRTKKMKKPEKMEPKKDFFALPKDDERKPVFYIDLGKKLNEGFHFGFTPYLRVSYSKSVHHGIPEYHGTGRGISYAKALFGFINKDEKNYKSRISFEDAVALKGEVDNESSVKMLLGEPQATSYHMYLHQDKRHKMELDIYEDKFSIRGIKQYWLKEMVEQPDTNGANKNMVFSIRPLKENTLFHGRVHFSSLSSDELGLLLWAIRLNDGCRQHIGLCKPYGFGRVKLEKLELNIENLEKKYGSFSFDYYDTAVIEDFVQSYKSYLSEGFLNGKKLDHVEPIKELMYIKSTIIKSDEREHYRYMPLDNYKKKIPLPTILEYSDRISNKFNTNYGKNNQGGRNHQGSPSYSRSQKDSYRGANRYGGDRRKGASGDSYKTGQRSYKDTNAKVYVDKNSDQGFNMPLAGLGGLLEERNKKK